MTTAQQLADMVQQDQTGAAAALEDQTIADADNGTSDALAALITTALAGWVTAFGSAGAASAGTALARYLTGVRASIDKATIGLGDRAARTISARLDEAATLGARHAVDFAARAAGHTLDVPEVHAPRDAVDAVRDIARSVREQLRISARLLDRRGVEQGGWARVLTGISAARRAVTLVARIASWAVHRSINAGSQAVIDTLGAAGLWVAEPTACVRCAAYSGRLTDTAGQFPGGLSLDPRQATISAPPIDGPPIHPHDRCRVIPWRTEWAPTRGLSLPDMLRTQALRGVATGRREPSESRTARLRAARHVASQPGVPAGIRHQARAAAAAGHF